MKSNRQAMVLVLLVVFAISPGVFAQDTASHEIGGPHPPVLHEFLCRDRILGDPSNFRHRMENLGLSLSMVYTAEGFWNVRGGINTHNAGEYRGDLSLFAEFDTEAAGLWDNGLFFLHVQHQHGHGITNHHVGDFQVLSNIDADHFTQISEFWYLHQFFEERLWLKVGKIEGNADFAGPIYGCEFINSSPGFAPTIPLVTYPDQDWGVVAGIVPTDWFSLNIGAFNGNPDGGRAPINAFEDRDGPFAIIEPAFHYSLAGHPGTFRVGGWWNDVDTDELDKNDPTPGTYDAGWGTYIVVDQEVWKEYPNDEENEEGIGVFLQYGYAPEERSDAEHYYGGGLQWVGAIPNRDDDIFGLGMFRVEFSDQGGYVDDYETSYECFYRAQVLNWLSLKPDVQYIVNPGGVGNKDALALGLRAEIVF